MGGSHGAAHAARLGTVIACTLKPWTRSSRYCAHTLYPAGAARPPIRRRLGLSWRAVHRIYRRACSRSGTRAGKRGRRRRGPRRYCIGRSAFPTRLSDAPAPRASTFAVLAALSADYENEGTARPRHECTDSRVSLDDALEAGSPMADSTGLAQGHTTRTITPPHRDGY